MFENKRDVEEKKTVPKQQNKERNYSSSILPQEEKEGIAESFLKSSFHNSSTNIISEGKDTPNLVVNLPNLESSNTVTNIEYTEDYDIIPIDPETDRRQNNYNKRDNSRRNKSKQPPKERYYDCT